MRKAVLFCFIFSCSLFGFADAQTTLVNYDFNSGTSYAMLSPALAAGITCVASSTETFSTVAGTASGAGAFTVNATAVNAITMNNSSGTNTRYFQFQIGGASLPGYINFKIYLQAQRSATGAQTITLAYSTDGTTYTNFSTTGSPGNGSFAEITFDISAITALNNQSNIYFRLLASGASGTGTLRIDNFQVQGISYTGVPILITPTAVNIADISADLGATITYNGGSVLTDRGTVYNTTAGVTITDNPSSEGGTTTGVFSHTRSPLSPQTLYYFAGYATNSGSGTALSSESSFYTLCNPPLTEATELTITPISTTQLNLNWTAATFPVTGANVNGYIILQRQDGTDPTISGVVSGISPAGLTLPGGTILVTTINSGATVAYSSTGLTGGTQYNYIIIPFTWDGANDGTYNYYLTNAPTANGLTFSSGSAVYFRSAQSGAWNSVSTWEYSTDGNPPWNTPSAVPTRYSRGIDIQGGHTITISASAEAALVTVESGATLSHSSNSSFYIADSTGVDLIVNGIYVINGTAPTFASGATAEIRSGGIVRADANTGGESDNFPQYTSVLFKTGSVMQWNTTLVFGSSNATYFQGTGYASEYPTFRITQNVGLEGASTTTTFNGKFEANGTITFHNSGTKNFRDGLGGTGGVITHSSTSGPFQISGAGAVIDGTVTVNFDDNSGVGINELVISSGADVTVSGTPVINIGTASAIGANMFVNGAITLSSGTTIDLSYGALTLNGSIGATSAGSFTASETNTDITIGGTGNSSAGILKLTTGFSTVNNFTMNRGSSASGGNIIMGSALSAKNFILTRGVIATGNNLVTWLNDGGSITGPANSIPWTSGAGNLYSNSFIATCNESGVAIAPSTPFDGTKGFRINNVTGGTDVYFPVGHSFSRTPNRLMINNTGTTSNFTVVMDTGDLQNTTQSRVNRIWYLNSSAASGVTANMKLFFTEKDPDIYAFPGTQDEVETGFDFTNIRLVQKNYADAFLNLSEVATSDVKSFLYGTYMGTEVYAEYNRSVSHDWQDNTNGIIRFSRFSIVNDLGEIILPVEMVNFRAYWLTRSIKIDWTSLNETNIAHYEVERSGTGNNFTTLGKQDALNTGSQQIDYNFIDAFPQPGDNYYRIKAVDNNGKNTYTKVVFVPPNNTIPGITIYPNPIQGRKATMQFTNVEKGRYAFILYSNSGAKLWQQDAEHPGGSATYQIQLPPGVSKGIYYLMISNGKSRTTETLLIE